MAKDTIYSLRVCNDSTVSGIKLVTDFLHQLHKEGNLQNRVFVVEDNPRKIPNLRKRPLEKEKTRRSTSRSMITTSQELHR